MYCTADTLRDTIKEQIAEAEQYAIINDRAPAVYSARVGRNWYHVGFVFLPVGTQAGETFTPIHPEAYVADPIIHWVKQ